MLLVLLSGFLTFSFHYHYHVVLFAAKNQIQIGVLQLHQKWTLFSKTYSSRLVPNYVELIMFFKQLDLYLIQLGIEVYRDLHELSTQFCMPLLELQIQFTAQSNNANSKMLSNTLLHNTT